MELVVREVGEQNAPRWILTLLHGRGSNEDDLLSLAGQLDTDARVVSVRAPYRLGPGYAWYTFTDDGQPRLAEMRASLDKLVRLVDGQPQNLPVVLLGFSQGGQMAQGVAIQRAGRPIRALLSLSAPPLLEIPPGRPLEGLPAFWGHGRSDPVVSPQRGEESLEVLTKLGAAVQARRYAMGHTVIPEEIRDLRAFLEAAVEKFPQ